MESRRSGKAREQILEIAKAMTEEQEKIIVSPVKAGFGQVNWIHVILPVPVPATAFLLEGIPC